MRLSEILTITPDLIPVSESIVGDKKIQTVDARVLHTFLEVTSKFADWIKNSINEYGFTENVDFVSLSKNLEKPEGGRPTIDYHLTFDMAKELSMVERNDKGRQARQYFIECERRAKEAMTDSIMLDQAKIRYLELENKYNDLERRVAQIEHIKWAKQTPKGNRVIETKEELRYRLIAERLPKFIEYADSLPRNQCLVKIDTYNRFISRYLKGSQKHEISRNMFGRYLNEYCKHNGFKLETIQRQDKLTHSKNYYYYLAVQGHGHRWDRAALQG
ncbi:anti-repressor protein [Candidatus Magnetobacterium bavaricum]|uniref:Anti-repressor protein n=1 Tax=Candidatus Magnetobacterium bavaricum TaxID=29290 RepID=A0A0F3GXV0_9BACT|nr:anti-repressor protein [Candidatus Magnetobacterium bavaricum]